MPKDAAGGATVAPVIRGKGEGRRGRSVERHAFSYSIVCLTANQRIDVLLTKRTWFKEHKNHGNMENED